MNVKTKEIRKLLYESMQRAAKGELPSDDGRNIIGMANQIAQSMTVEVKVNIMKERLGQKLEQFGHLVID